MARRALALLCGVVLAFTAGGAHGLPSDTWLVAIGNNEGDADELGLLYAERDARELAETLRTVGGLSTRRTLLLLGEEAAEVRRELLRVNTEIRARTQRSSEPTALVVFYSGHADADALHLGGGRLPFDELRALVQGSPASLRVLVVDACRSGQVTRVKGVRPAESFRLDLDNQMASEGVAVITSSAAGESSQESDHLRGSFFSHHLINALRGAADRNADGKVTLTEAYAYTYGATLRSSGRTLDLQHPTYQYDVKGRGEVVLATPGAKGSRSARLRLAEPGVYLVAERGEGGPVVAEVSPPQARAVLALPANTYFVQQRRPREYREYRVKLSPGDETDLQSQPHHAVAYDRLVRRRGGQRRYVPGLTAVCGARGEVIDGEGAAPQLSLGYGVDLPELSIGLRLRGATAWDAGVDEQTQRRHDELGLGLVLQRYVDLRALSLSFGLVVEGVVHWQRFDTSRQAADRRAAGASFAGLFGLERRLLGPVSMRIEGGPVTTLFQQTSDSPPGSQGPPDSELRSPFTWWASGGLVWRQ